MSKVELPLPSKDPRGYIQNLIELSSEDQAVHGAAIIFSRARTTRSNHMHRTDAHWLYVISGEMHYWSRADGEPQYARDPVVVKPGEMVFTGPLVWHRTHFPAETVLLSLSLRARDHSSHEEDVVRDGTK